MTSTPDSEVSPPVAELTWQDVFPSHPRGSEQFIAMPAWAHPVTFFVGRNGSGKTRTARLLSERTGAQRLSTDRLMGLMRVSAYTWGTLPDEQGYEGVPLSENLRRQAEQQGRGAGVAAAEMYALRESPDTLLRVAAFLRRALSRNIELRERAGFLDPVIVTQAGEYSLLRDEGHGLRELVVLLAAAYRSDWTTLVVDEPELHLHPSMARLWLSELQDECRHTNRHAVVITHEPQLIRPTAMEDLKALWLFQPERRPANVSSAVIVEQKERVTASLQQNPSLVSDLVFSPRPVLVEGSHDVSALTAALNRTARPEAVAQTDLVPCGGGSMAAMWFEIARKLGLDVRVVVDLDVLFTHDLPRAVDGIQEVRSAYAQRLAAEPPRTSTALRPLLEQMSKDGVAADPRERAKWLATLGTDPGDGHAARRDIVLDICKSVGIWLHPQGTLESVLGISDKGGEKARLAATNPGPIDDVAAWCVFKLDLAADIGELLNLAVERIVHSIVETLRLDPARKFYGAPANVIGAERLVKVEPSEEGLHRVTVISPEQYAGWWLEFGRDTSPNELVLKEPPSNGTN